MLLLCPYLIESDVEQEWSGAAYAHELALH